MRKFIYNGQKYYPNFPFKEPIDYTVHGNIEPIPTINTILIDDEFDTDNIMKDIEQNKRLLIEAKYYGCGKSQLINEYINRKYLKDKCVLVFPYNKLAYTTRIKTGFNVSTFHNYFRNYF